MKIKGSPATVKVGKLARAQNSIRGFATMFRGRAMKLKRLTLIAIIFVLNACGNHTFNDEYYDEEIYSSSSSNNVQQRSSSSSNSSSSESSILKTYFTDTRDGKKYKSVEIGTQTWMAENLNYAGDGNVGRCYGDSAGNCAQYGRMYIVSEVACPSGWHLPSNDEWNVLLNFLSVNAGTKLKAASPDWNGTDDYGFAALPGGYCGNACPDNNSPFTGMGTISYWWTSSVGAPVALSITRSISGSNNVGESQSYSNSRFYARCIQGLSSSSSSEMISSSSEAISSSSNEQQSSSSETISSSSSEQQSSSSETISSSSSEQQSSSSISIVLPSSNSLLINFTVSQDYKKGELRWMKTSATRLDNGIMSSFSRDSKISASGGYIFVLGNSASLSNGDVSCILPGKIGDESTAKQFSLDAKFPYEAAVIGSNGYIALNDNDKKYVQIFNINTCTLGETIELPAASAVSIKASGNTLLVVLQRLNNSLAATDPGLLVRINATTKTLIDTIQLKYYNPHSAVLGNGKLYISSQGTYNDDYIASVDVTKAGIEVVDLAKGTTEVLVTGTQLGAGGNSIALDEANQVLYVSAYVQYKNVPVKPVNLLSKTVGEALPNITDASGGLVFDDAQKKLFVGDRASAGGLKFYNPAIGTTTSVNGTALPPYSLAIVRW